MTDIPFSDRTIPPGGLISKPDKHRPLRRLNLLVTLEDMGELSFYPFIILLAGLTLTPLGGFALFTAAMGFGIVVFALQLLLRMPHVLLPEAFRSLLSKNRYLQAAAQWYAELEPRRASNGKPTGHWLAFRPFDVLPKTMLLLAGAALPFTTTIPYMTGTLALAAILLSAGLTLRSSILVVCGALLISASSLMPAFT